MNDIMTVKIVETGGGVSERASLEEMEGYRSVYDTIKNNGSFGYS